jgi:hypothetical protein
MPSPSQHSSTGRSASGRRGVMSMSQASQEVMASVVYQRNVDRANNNSSQLSSSSSVSKQASSSSSSVSKQASQRRGVIPMSKASQEVIFQRNLQRCEEMVASGSHPALLDCLNTSQETPPPASKPVRSRLRKSKPKPKAKMASAGKDKTSKFVRDKRPAAEVMTRGLLVPPGTQLQRQGSYRNGRGIYEYEAGCSDGSADEGVESPTWSEVVPSRQPSCELSAIPSGEPTGQPSGEPYGVSTGQPSGEPSAVLSGEPTGQPSRKPSGVPSGQLSGKPSYWTVLLLTSLNQPTVTFSCVVPRVVQRIVTMTAAAVTAVRVQRTISLGTVWLMS